MGIAIRRVGMLAALAATIAALGVLASCDPGDDGSGQWRKFGMSTSVAR